MISKLQSNVHERPTQKKIKIFRLLVVLTIGSDFHFIPCPEGQLILILTLVVMSGYALQQDWVHILIRTGIRGGLQGSEVRGVNSRETVRMYNNSY